MAGKGKRKLQEEKEQLDLDLQNVLATREGRNVIRWIVYGLGGLHASTFNIDAGVAAFGEGARNLALNLMSEIGRLDPGQMQVLLAEFVESEYMVLPEKETTDEP